MRVAVELPSDLASPGEFLADVQAYEAAGADAVWLVPGSLEPLTLAAAAAAVTSRIGLVAWLPGPDAWPEEPLAAVVATLRRLSGDRVAFGVAGVYAIAALRAAAAGRPVLLAGDGEHAAQRADGLVRDLEGAGAAFEGARALRPPPEFELWARLPAPATGVAVPHAPNLLDILRNPEEDDRQDLAMATG
ncbi:MAG: LLM class flavin-dependent oxidoreductase [Chloroflexi bacterium]|nr:MAG: LLM class flavin-dependent oxidoreductase [Chloroflexota bacterium]